MEIKAFPNGIFGATTYLVYDETSKEAVLIDCTCGVFEIVNFIKKEKLNLKYILITHGHFDHVYCVSEMKKHFPIVPVMIHKDDIDLLNQVGVQCSMAEINEIEIPCVDALIDEKTKNLTIGSIPITIIHTKGHSKGGVCYLIKDKLFSGDTLFKESVGRCDLYGGDFSEIEQSIKDKLFTLDENITVYPGHGYPTTISHEKSYNQYFGSNC